jgi:hypothetical protein
VGATLKRDERVQTRSWCFKNSTLFGNLAIVAPIFYNKSFRPMTLRRQFSLVLPVRWSGDHGQLFARLALDP